MKGLDGSTPSICLESGDLMKRKIAFGFNDIHIAKLIKGRFDKPIRVHGGKEVNIELYYKETIAQRGNNNIYFEQFENGSGTLSVVGLTLDEYQLMFGCTIANGRLKIKTTDDSSRFALMFSKQLADGNKQCYCFYNCRFKPIGVNAKTTSDGSINENTIDIDFTIDSFDKDIYYTEIDNLSFFNQVVI